MRKCSKRYPCATFFLCAFLHAFVRPNQKNCFLSAFFKKVLPPFEQAGDSFASIVFKYYDQFDAQFVKVLNDLSSNGNEDANKLLEALAVEQQKKIASATEVLKSVLALGDPMRMEGAIVKMAREGKIDEPFLLLLEANANQARSAGADGPAQLMDKLKKRAAEEKDKQMTSKEIRLLRQLLRSNDAAEREKILEDAFTPRENLLVREIDNVVDSCFVLSVVA
jgi:hypothetical protein